MFSSFSVNGLVRYLKLKLLGRDIIISGSCHQCGSCCRKLSLDINGSWVSSISEFNELVENNPDYIRFKIIGRDKYGFLEFTCTWLQEDGTCLDYQNRFKICKDYPNKNMFFIDGILLPQCGYSMQESVPFKKILKKKMKGTGKERDKVEKF